jgi:hypothetical protein
MRGSLPDSNPNRQPNAGSNSAPGRDDPALDPFEIEFRAEFRDNRGPRDPFVNSQGVVIGDHDYESPDSPLEQWSEETDPVVMSGDEWVHPYKDIGFRTRENRELFEKGIMPFSGVFMHPSGQVSSGDEPYADSENHDLLANYREEDDDNYPVPEVLDEP